MITTTPVAVWSGIFRVFDEAMARGGGPDELEAFVRWQHAE